MRLFLLLKQSDIYFNKKNSMLSS